MMRKRDIDVTRVRDEDGGGHLEISTPVGQVILYDDGIRVVQGDREYLLFSLGMTGNGPEFTIRMGEIGVTIQDARHRDGTTTWGWTPQPEIRDVSDERITSFTTHPE